MHALGILMIEIGVTICVMSTIIDIMDIIIEGRIWMISEGNMAC